MEENYIDEARCLLSDFINEEVAKEDAKKEFHNDSDHKKCIKDHVDDLLDFSFLNIKNKDKYLYAKADRQDIDGDRTKVTYIIYCLLWGDDLHIKFSDYLKTNSDNEHPTTSKINFSGDTICTFNTLFGRDNVVWFNDFKNRKTNNMKFGDDCLSVFSDEQLIKINDFRLKYQTIPNFYPLPCKPLDDSKITLNLYRGNFRRWGDFFDTFLSNLEVVLEHGIENKYSKDIKNLIDNNSHFFDTYKTRNDFVKLFKLQPFNDLRFTDEEKKLRYDNDNTLDAYKVFAMKYIDKVTKCIDDRKEKIEKELENKIEEIF